MLFNLKGKCGQGSLISHDTLGQFGDFYGGVLGTIITIVGLIYIYRTYKVQNIQLDVAKKDADLSIINKLYSELLQDINSIQYRRKKADGSGDILFEGIDALYNFDQTHVNNPNSVLNHLNSILVSFEQIIMMANKVKYKYTDMKDITLTKIYFLYFSKIIWPVYQEIYKHRKAELISAKHAGAEFLFEKYEQLTRESYRYLITKKHVYPPNPSDKEMIDLLNK
jgi:hypothetical protein